MDDPPALRYGSAALAKYFHLLPARGYHLYTAILYCSGTSGVYLLVLAALALVAWAWLGRATSTSRKSAPPDGPL